MLCCAVRLSVCWAMLCCAELALLVNSSVPWCAMVLGVCLGHTIALGVPGPSH
jgi:hypothetical protein